ncbi:MAG: Gfo/Idh/MocA family oxidoreductase [Campylobacterota bacterium]|nr:Gfo/Idh/MocA family oxidoreductase [Campylobacterota bacterium]
MKKTIITYGTYDMFHIGHLNLIKRAKGYGDYLIVGVTSEDYDRSRGKLNVTQTTQQRVDAIENLDFVDEVVVETHKNQKVEDIKKYGVDTFVIGDDWIGHFDYLKEHCDVQYIPRTKGISSTMLREDMDHEVKIGIIGTGRIAKRFASESTFVPNITVHSALSRNIVNVQKFIKENGILYGFDNLDDFFDTDIDAVYIASPHENHYEHIKMALLNNKHVLCEKPIVLENIQLDELMQLAKDKNLILLEAIKTAFFPAFNKLLDEIESGIIGEVKEVRATFTKLTTDKTLRELQPPYGGATYELASYPLLLAQKILGESLEENFFDIVENNVDTSNRIVCKHKNDAISISTVGLGVKSEGSAVISGTKGYIYIPAPWWLTKDFYVRFEDTHKEYSFHYDLEGSGLRYEISEFSTMIQRKELTSNRMSHNIILDINKIISNYKAKK